ncbi:MAG: radical SAM protein, partial [Selenomonadaceae bacterium]|nr:radical SAM protein [Selenomonadaceae bacterium]
HVEVTTLIVPRMNDSEEEMDAEAKWLASISKDIPLHVSRFFPRYKVTDRPPTDVDIVYRLAEVARRHLNFVYTGNC